MAEDFYKEWLGINPSTHEPDMPPDHYTLLGLPHFCHHPEAVDISAKQRLENLDKFAMLPERQKREAATRIMNEVATARVALSDPENYKRYDQLLSQRLGVQVPDKEVPPPSNLLPLLADQQAYELDLGDDVPQAPAGVKPLDASLADIDDGPEIQLEADLNASRASNTNPIPFTTIIIALSALFLLILGIVIASVMFLGGDNSGTTAQFKTTVINPKPSADSAELLSDGSRSGRSQNPEDRKLGKPDVSDDYNRLTLGNSYRVRTTAGQGAKIQNKKLQMIIGGSDNGETRVEYTPMQTDAPIKQVSFNLTLDRKSTFVLALANGSVRLTLNFTGSQLLAEARPGGPPAAQTQYPTINTDGKSIHIRARRTPDSVLWYVNESPVATSPNIDPRSTATVTLNLMGTPGSKAQLDHMQVWYPQ